MEEELSIVAKRRILFFPLWRPRGRGPAIAEAVFAGAMVLVGVVLLGATITTVALFSTPEQLYIPVWFLSLRIVLAVAMMGIGSYSIIALLWRVGVSKERREALVNRAGEIDLLNEFRRRREDLPTVPIEAPQRGGRFPYRLVAASPNLGSMIAAGAMSVSLVAILSILVPTAFSSGGDRAAKNVAGIFSPIILLAAVWFLYRFFRQLLRLVAIGPASIELSRYPLFPNSTCQARLQQPGRIRLRKVTAWLVCQEEATYNDGTDIRTEQKDVFKKELYHQRAVNVCPEQPLDVEFDLAVPADAMHCFKSENNRIQWKIIVQAEANGWLKLTRTFRLSVFPQTAIETRPVARL